MTATRRWRGQGSTSQSHLEQTSCRRWSRSSISGPRPCSPSSSSTRVRAAARNSASTRAAGSASGGTRSSSTRTPSGKGSRSGRSRKRTRAGSYESSPWSSSAASSKTRRRRSSGSTYQRSSTTDSTGTTPTASWVSSPDATSRFRHRVGDRMILSQTPHASQSNERSSPTATSPVCG